MSKLESLLKEATDLIKEIEENPTLTRGSAIEVTDQSEIAAKYLTNKAQAALSKKSKTLTHKDETGAYECIYLGLKVANTHVSEGIQAICESLNALADQNLIHSCLCPVSSLALAQMSLEVPTSAVIAYVLVPSDKKKEAEEIAKYVMNDCGPTKTLGDVEVKGDEDEFFALIRLSVATLGDKSGKERLDDEIQQYLNVLPKGTEVVEIRQDAIMDLSVPYTVKFKNPLMKAFKEVRLEYRRHAEEVGDKIEQFSLLQKVEYIRK